MNSPLSWNRIPRVAPDHIRQLTSRRQALPASGHPLLAYGQGRSYGDVCLTDQGTLLLTRGLDHLIHFEADTGVLRCEAGVTLAEVLNLVVPRGWFLAVTPGTRYATVGGAVANDVHGKNHHFAGSFGHHVRRLELVRSDGDRLECAPDQNGDLFAATIGGLGLTGLIAWVELQLVRISNPWMWTQSRRFRHLDEFWLMNEAAEREWPYVVAWVDCLASGRRRGRGVLHCGLHAPSQAELPGFRERHRRFPLDPPFSLVNGLSLRAFNTLYYHKPVFPAGQLSHYVPYFYPLDALRDWNRLYGRKGFFQYQCVLPPDTTREGVDALLRQIAHSGEGSFLAVLKSFGHQPSRGLLSFPRPGTTLALDFPNRGSVTRNLLARLDGVVRQAGGALYPAKDARMPADLFQSGFPQWEHFSEFVDPAFSSNFWRRVTV